MINFKRLTDTAKKTIDKRGGMDSVKEDAQELRDIAKGKGSLKDKATEAGKAIKDPGAKGRNSREPRMRPARSDVRTPSVRFVGGVGRRP